jgi:predicted NACHT family NTPase
VWLLLDGADEIVASSGIALSEINNQLRGWLSQSCIILTCRINVWEVDINALRDFQTYRTKQFHYPTQVERFIESGFRKSNQQSGERLKTELANTERTRLQQLVRNPLRLMMLCTTWQEQESLPATKAELYKRFVSEFYKWNRSKWKKKDLNYAFFPNTVAKEESSIKLLGV